MTSTVTLEHAATGAIELRRSPFQIILDAKPAGSIDRHQTVELHVQPGHHTVQVKAGRYTSPARSFDAADGATINFRCNSRSALLRADISPHPVSGERAGQESLVVLR